MQQSTFDFFKDNLCAGISIRPVLNSDDSFLKSLFYSITEAKFPFPDESMKKQLIAVQFDARENSYNKNYPELLSFIINDPNRDLGLLQISQTNDQIQLVNIEISPTEQGKGIGKELLNTLQRLAQSLKVSIGLSVSTDNIRAIKFYTAMGFQKESSESVYKAMRWTPESGSE